MEKEKLKNKMFFFTWILIMCGILIGIAYTFFLRNIKVDVTSQLAIEYDGENGVASVEVYYNGNDLNKRTQEFLETCTYKVEPGTNLSNGDVVKIITSYDENLAKEYNYEPVNVEKEIVVEGLYNKYERYQDIDADYKEKVLNAESNYVKNHVKDIYRELYPGYPSYTKAERKVVYKGFLDGIEEDTRDRLIEIIRIDYVVPFEKEVEKEEIEKKEASEEEKENLEISEEKEESEVETITVNEVYTLYYLVTLPGINEGKVFDTQDIFGEKAYLSEEEKKTQNYESYIQRIYKNKYNIQTIERVIIEPGIEKEEAETK
ncbi:MAG: hypothetical protein Q4C49_11305 [Bacillota bacterium]|nr:hypothetical protein [Bacillota bacterium]